MERRCPVSEMFVIHISRCKSFMKLVVAEDVTRFRLYAEPLE